MKTEQIQEPKKISDILTLEERQIFFKRAVNILMNHFELSGDEVYEAIGQMNLHRDNWSDDF